MRLDWSSVRADVDYHIGRFVLGLLLGWRLGAVRLE